MHRPYVGITGFMSREEVQSILDVVPEDSTTDVMIGVLASLKTLRGETNKWPNRYPEVGKIKDIFIDHPKALNLIHYNSKEDDYLFDQLCRMTDLGGPNFHGFQLNMAWPSILCLKNYRHQFAKKIVLQIGGHAFEMVDHSADRLAEWVSDYEGYVDYVLLDPSGGYGIPFDTVKAADCLDALKEKNLDIGLGVAGGLSPTTLNLVEALRNDFPDLSIDAEGKLRDADDRLDVEVAKEYLLKSLGVPYHKVCTHTLETNWPIDSGDYEAHTTCEGNGRCKWVIIPKKRRAAK